MADMSEEVVKQKKKKKDKRKSQEAVQQLMVSEPDSSLVQQVRTFGMCETGVVQSVSNMEPSNLISVTLSH